MKRKTKIKHQGKPEYLYHGSPDKLRVLRLDQAGRIFATSYRAHSIAYALPPVSFKRNISGWYKVGGCTKHKLVEMICCFTRPAIGEKGYIYKLSSKGFRRVVDQPDKKRDEWVKARPVKPIEISEVYVDDNLPLYRAATKREIAKMKQELRNKEKLNLRGIDYLGPWERVLAKKACQAYKIVFSSVHPWEHTLRVVNITKMIAKQACPDNLRAAVTAAYLHDLGRTDESGGTEHARKGAKIAPRYYAKGLTDTEQRTITFAIAHHADSVAPNGGYPVTSNYIEIIEKGLIEKVIAAMWDADRIERRRIGPVLQKYFSTKYARKILKEIKQIKT